MSAELDLISRVDALLAEVAAMRADIVKLQAAPPVVSPEITPEARLAAEARHRKDMLAWSASTRGMVINPRSAPQLSDYLTDVDYVWPGVPASPSTPPRPPGIPRRPGSTPRSI
jgi:hypothetical protein